LIFQWFLRFSFGVLWNVLRRKLLSKVLSKFKGENNFTDKENGAAS